MIALIAMSAGALTVASSQGFVQIRAEQVPVVEVLSQLANANDFRLDVIGGLPRESVSLILDGDVIEAITRILKEAGLSYGMALRNGRLQRLIVVEREATPGPLPAVEVVERGADAWEDGPLIVPPIPLRPQISAYDRAGRPDLSRAGLEPD